MYSRSAKGGEKGDPNRSPWLAKMNIGVHIISLTPMLTAGNELFLLLIKERGHIDSYRRDAYWQSIEGKHIDRAIEGMHIDRAIEGVHIDRAREGVHIDRAI